jgi:hypothetical protein
VVVVVRLAEVISDQGIHERHETLEAKSNKGSSTRMIGMSEKATVALFEASMRDME